MGSAAEGHVQQLSRAVNLLSCLGGLKDVLEAAQGLRADFLLGLRPGSYIHQFVRAADLFLYSPGWAIMCALRVARNLRPGFLEGEGERHVQQLVQALNLFPCPGRVVKSATQDDWSVGWGTKPIRMPTELLSK